MDTFLSKSSEDTQRIAASFASSLRRNDIVLLIGELGSGKTQFAKGICRFFDVREPVSSPTFVMLHRYCGKDVEGREILIFHLDLYKIRSYAELLELGYEELFRGNGVCLIEWGDALGPLTPEVRTEVSFRLGASEQERHIDIQRVSKGRPSDTVHSCIDESAKDNDPRH
jgi:tRNA threonylcarbamoyladenosine biosynthesis protein TsaE